jgi:hypothetical protein
MYSWVENIVRDISVRIFHGRTDGEEPNDVLLMSNAGRRSHNASRIVRCHLVSVWALYPLAFSCYNCKSLGWDILSSKVCSSVQPEEKFLGINITH